ncbi:MAG: DUF6599 family protein [Fibrobacterota bacterium]
MRTVFLTLVLACALFAAAPISLLPADNAVVGWVDDTDTASSCYDGSAVDLQTLYDLIDGGASEYTNRGYQGSAYNGYSNGSGKICVELYDQGTASNALQVYQYFFSTGEECRPVAGLGDSARMDTSSAFNNNLEFIAGRYFVRIIIQFRDPYKIDSTSLEISAIAFGQSVAAAAISVEGVRARVKITGGLTTRPSPATGQMVIEAGIKGERAVCRIFDGAGRMVRILDALPAAGGFRVAWDRKDVAGRSLAAGSYIAEIRSARESVRGRVTLF